MRSLSARLLIATLALPTFATPAKAQNTGQSADTFHNPLLPTGPDPWVIT